ncbi:hypothetical protein BaRGS_00026584, partial [Batillaria attramentaria]
QSGGKSTTGQITDDRGVNGIDTHNQRRDWGNRDTRRRCGEGGEDVTYSVTGDRNPITTDTRDRNLITAPLPNFTPTGKLDIKVTMTPMIIYICPSSLLKVYCTPTGLLRSSRQVYYIPKVKVYSDDSYKSTTTLAETGPYRTCTEHTRRSLPDHVSSAPRAHAHRSQFGLIADTNPSLKGSATNQRELLTSQRECEPPAPPDKACLQEHDRHAMLPSRRHRQMDLSDPDSSGDLNEGPVSLVWAQ